MAKYKLKTHKSTAKRFKITATGKILRRKMQNRNNAHLKSKRKSSRKLVPGSFVITSSGYVRKIKKLINA